MAIYGQEVVRYTWNVVDDDACVVSDTLDWWIEDTELDGSDNTTEVVDAANDATQDKSYHSVGDKHLHTEVDFLDGWDNTYQHLTELDVTTVVYDVPVLDYSWTPEAPTVIDEVEFTQAHEDTRNEEEGKAYGRIDQVDVDYYVDGELDEEELGDENEWTHVFPTKADDGLDIKLIATYWDGWEYQTVDITKHMEMTNIPPVADHSREDRGLCIPNYLWNANESTDLDDAVEELTYEWWLYQWDEKDTEDEEDDEWVEIETGTEITFTYPFQFEGDYKLVLRTTDDDGDWTEKVEEFPIEFAPCDSSGAGSSSGVIMLQPNMFQMIAIPVPGVKVKEYFLDRVAETIGADASTVIEYVGAYGANDVNAKKWQIFFPDYSNPENDTNFELVQADGDAAEITAIKVKMLDFEEPIEFKWDSKDGEE